MPWPTLPLTLAVVGFLVKPRNFSIGLFNQGFTVFENAIFLWKLIRTSNISIETDLEIICTKTYILGCPLDLSESNVTLVASVCSSHDDHGKCCRYINAFVAVSIARYANATSYLGIDSDVSEFQGHPHLQHSQIILQVHQLLRAPAGFRMTHKGIKYALLAYHYDPQVSQGSHSS